MPLGTSGSPAIPLLAGRRLRVCWHLCGGRTRRGLQRGRGERRWWCHLRGSWSIASGSRSGCCRPWSAGRRRSLGHQPVRWIGGTWTGWAHRRASLNSGLGNTANQLLFSGGGGAPVPFSTGSVVASVLGRAAFGAASLGIGSTTLIGNVGLGIAGGVTSGAASGVATASGLGGMGVVFIAP